MFGTLLIANRGEIACRVIRTARRMGIRTVAVFSEADRDALHVHMADVAYPIGPAPARESYLRVERIIGAARASGAEAVHPGYGFLSENADFAEACAAAGVAFIGPPPAAIRAMGSKSAAKALMQRAGVPLVPGYHGADQDPALLAREAARVGYPVLIKASAGGGGKGMRVVERPEGFAEALAGAQGEARASFGDDAVLIERYLTQPRHIEIQVFADSRGNTVSLFERDCSIQRRHQKVIEEAPAPGMTEERRAAMGRAACDAARAVGYVGAGTVEFIVDAGPAAEGGGGAFYFMEMNTRLQVEHPVTEMVTNLDLVEMQIRVAAGEGLARVPEAPHGHAIEVRVYAEDPAREFMPSTGTLVHLRQPAGLPQVRVDTGVRQGDAITPNYDPMIAKLVAWGADRDEAARRLSAALAEYEVVGVQTNLDLLRRVTAHPAFLGAELDTGFLARYPEVLAPVAAGPPPLALAAAALRVLRDEADAARRQAAGTADPHSPWALATAWRMNGDGYQDLVLRHGADAVTLRAHPGPRGACVLDLPGGPVRAEAEEAGPGLRLDGVRHEARVVRQGDELAVLLDGRPHVLQRVDPLAPPRHEAAGSDRVLAPIPGRVARILVQPGDAVRKGAPLLVLEAMKMELTLSAPLDGTVEAVRCTVDGMVEEGTELVTFAQEAAGT